MLQDKYGRLAIVAVFIVVAVILIMAPGMSSNKSNEAQLNFTSMPKDNVSKQNRNIDNSDLNANNSSDENEKTFATPEDQMLDSWGMSTKSDDVPKEVSKAPSNELLIAEQQEVNITPANEPEVPKKPKFKPIKVNGKCFAAPIQSLYLLNTECLAANYRMGVKACPADNVKDGWAGAVRTCGGINNMPDMDDLLAIARELYTTSSIRIPETERNNYKAYSQFTETDIQCDNYEMTGVNYKESVAKEYGYPEQAGFSVWGKTEINPNYGLSLNFEKNTVKYTSCSPRTNTDYYTICRVECEL